MMAAQTVELRISIGAGRVWIPGPAFALFLTMVIFLFLIQHTIKTILLF